MCTNYKMQIMLKKVSVEQEISEVKNNYIEKSEVNFSESDSELLYSSDSLPGSNVEFI